MIAPVSRSARRHDLDWLRVIAFGLLILYHVGMFYVTWDWHVKSSHASSFAEPAMALLNPWRLALLFFISGVAVRFALSKYGTLAFLRERTIRLFLPLAFGMAVVVMPQAYAELVTKGEIQPGILAFWPRYLEIPGPFTIITPTWNHLWYLAYVLSYSLLAAVAAPLLARLQPSADRLFAAAAADASGVVLLAVLALPFVFYRALLDPVFPTTHAFGDDWAAHAHFLTIFLFGWFAAGSGGFWNAVERHWLKALVLAGLLGAAIVAARLDADKVRSLPALHATMQILRVAYAWLVIVALLGAARRWLDRPGPALSYLTNAMFPYYILHQTLIVWIGFAILGAGLSAPVEVALVLTGTLAGCVVGYELVRRLGPARVLFGLPWRERSTRPAPAPAA